MARKDHHPHHAGHRHAGIKVGENAKRSGPQPGQHEFSADEEKAMRAANSGMSANGGGAAPMAGPGPAMPPDNDADDAAPAGAPPAPGAAPMAPDLDADSV
jgi:hypothetical protein